MREIGGEFWDVPKTEKTNKLFPIETKWFLSGRNALGYIISDIKTKHGLHSVAIPSWCCDSMIIPFIRAGIIVKFYPVYVCAGCLVQETDIDCDAILVMDYFGYSSDADYSNYPGVVIRDLTHSIFCKEYSDADYYFGGLRKWAGFYGGGFAWSNEQWTTLAQIKKINPYYKELRDKAMSGKKKYIIGLSGIKGYLKDFAKAEHLLNSDWSIQSAVQKDIISARNLDIEYIKTKRNENAKILLEKLREYAVFPQIKETDCPLFFPIMISNRENLKKHLIENEIYCPVHWPISEYHILNDKTKKIYNEELSIVCDQRYSSSDMERICKIIEMR